MPSLRSVLKKFFSSGEKPTEAEFHELIDSFYHKTEDGLIMTEEGNFGIGVETPDARLHIEGGLKIGDAPEDATQVPQGTLRWTGSQLQISFNGTWQPVWKQATETHKTQSILHNLGNKKISTPQVTAMGPFNFPPKAVQLLRVTFVLDYDKSKSTTVNNPLVGGTIKIQNNRKFNITIQSSSGVTLLSRSVNFPEGERSNLTYGPIEITGNKSIDNVPTFSMQFSISGTTGTHNVTLKSVTVVCLCKN